MGCIRADIKRVGGNLSISTKKSNDELSINVSLLNNDLTFQTDRFGGDLLCQTNRIGGNLNIAASLICSVDPNKKLLKIEPMFIWLTEENNFTEIVNVLSNTDWTVK